MGRPTDEEKKLKFFVAKRCEKLGVSPVDVLIECMQQDQYRFLAAKELMQYCFPKLKSMEFTLKDIPDEAFDEEVQRRINLKILRGEKVG